MNGSIAALGAGLASVGAGIHWSGGLWRHDGHCPATGDGGQDSGEHADCRRTHGRGGPVRADSLHYGEVTI